MLACGPRQERLLRTVAVALLRGELVARMQPDQAEVLRQQDQACAIGHRGRCQALRHHEVGGHVGARRHLDGGDTQPGGHRIHVGLFAVNQRAAAPDCAVAGPALTRATTGSSKLPVTEYS